MFCKKCGEQLREGATFCGKCGTALGVNTPDQGDDSESIPQLQWRSSSPQPQPQPQPPQQPLPKPQPSKSPRPSGEKKPLNKNVWIAIAVGLVVLVGVVVAVFILLPKADESPQLSEDSAALAEESRDRDPEATASEAVPESSEPEDTAELPTNPIEPASEPVATGNSETAAKNALVAMSKSERKDLHTFFSNFAESGMGSFDINNYDVNKLIYFALSYNEINYAVRWTYASESVELYIASDYVATVIMRFFGITGIDHASYADPYSSTRYANGNYYIPATTSGEPLKWAQVTEFIDNSDGTYTAKYDVYSGYTSMDDNIYEDKSYWSFSAPYKYLYSALAVVKPYNNSGKATYQLLRIDS